MQTSWHYQVVIILERVVQFCDPAFVTLQQNFPFLLVARGLYTTNKDNWNKVEFKDR